MVGKRRKHKTVVPYRRVVGSGLAEVPALIESLDLNQSRGPKASDSAGVELSPLLSVVGESPLEGDTKSIDLPLEIIDIICHFCTKRFPLLLVNRRWHDMALRHVYATPELNPHNFFLFVQAISQDRALGALVRELDLVKIAQVGEKSMTSRLLRRCSPKLERFIAAQSHFGYLPMISLGSCHRLKVLDLSLVSETVDLPQLFATIRNFHDLEVLHFPRSSIDCPDDAEMPWAPNLRQLGLSGGFPAKFLERTEFPPGLTQLQISNCPYMTTPALIELLHKIGPQLKRLVVVYPVPLLAPTALDSVLYLCPNLKTLHVSIDYITSSALDPDLLPPSHPLESLMLLSSGMIGHAEKIRPSDVLMATDQLSSLSRVSTSLLMGWNPESSILLGLVDVMGERGGGVWMI